MIPVIIAAAALCALCCLWMFRPMRTPRAFYAAAFACAAFTLGLYLYLGNPDLPAHPTKPSPQALADMQQEAMFMEALRKNPRDADTMIRLAALRVVQGRDRDGTLQLLDRAENAKPGDRRITIIRSMLLYPNPEMKD